MAGNLAGADPKIKEIMTSLDDDKIGKFSQSCLNPFRPNAAVLLKKNWTPKKLNKQWHNANNKSKSSFIRFDF